MIGTMAVVVSKTARFASAKDCAPLVDSSSTPPAASTASFHRWSAPAESSVYFTTLPMASTYSVIPSLLTLRTAPATPSRPSASTSACFTALVHAPVTSSHTYLPDSTPLFRSSSEIRRPSTVTAKPLASSAELTRS